MQRLHPHYTIQYLSPPLVIFTFQLCMLRNARAQSNWNPIIFFKPFCSFTFQSLVQIIKNKTNNKKNSLSCKLFLTPLLLKFYLVRLDDERTKEKPKISQKHFVCGLVEAYELLLDILERSLCVCEREAAQHGLVHRV